MGEVACEPRAGHGRAWGPGLLGGAPAILRSPACQPRDTPPLSRAVTPKRASETNTLGDLLYADGSATTIGEQEWVRLIEAIAAGDQQALRALYERTHRMVFTLVMRICGHREMTEEVTLDVFHDVWRRSAQYDPKGGSVVGWVMMQARSRALDRLRFEQRKKRVPASPGHREALPEASGPADAIDARQRRGSLEAALAALTPDERQAIETAFFSELSYSETAARLDQPLGTVKTRVRSALAKLRKALSDNGGQS
jgi:RNA polymerase sigma-70 factor, ECF subfamily